jgi:ribosomal protein S18 acetylase RimI-like enzyme
MVQQTPQPADAASALAARLDNPVWHALRGPQATLAERVGGAARFPRDVSVFAAIDDDRPAGWADLARLVGPGEAAVLFRRPFVAAEGWARELFVPTLQLWWPGGLEPPARAPDAVELGDDDVDDMVELVARTQPGPFERRTHRMGTYLGIRDGDRLVAIAGERLCIDGATEISAVCTDEDHRGRGLAGSLVGELISRIQRRGAVPFLHAATTNTAALRLYRQLGFDVRAEVEAVVVRAPPSD